MMFRIAVVGLTVFLSSAVAQAQVPQSPLPAMATAPAPAAAVDPVLEQLQQTAQSTTSDVSRLRIDRWKADSGTKQQAQEMASSVSRNLTSAFPELIQSARSQPASLASQFKLYHNLTALYETLASLAETTGAFGGKQEYDALSSDANRLDAQRRSLADYLQKLAAQNDSDLARLRTQAAHTAAAAAAAPPKKVVVDDDTSASKPAAAAKKKPAAKKPAATSSPNTSPQQPPE